jgi:GAF domain-containing protein
MGERMRSLDWSSTPVGPVQDWPQSLRTAVSMCLGSQHPIEIWWGPEYVRFYNDAYRPILGSQRHPQFLGRPGRECWGEIWDRIGFMLDGVRETGVATWSEDYELFLTRNGYTEETYFTFSYAPLRDETGGVGGIFCACTETTSSVLMERRLETLRALASASVGSNDPDEVFRLSLAAISRNPFDVPWALLYSLEDKRELTSGESLASLLGWTGFGQSAVGPLRPSVIPLGKSGSDEPGRCLSAVAHAPTPTVVENAEAAFGELPANGWPEISRAAVIVPILLRSRTYPIGLLVMGANPRTPLDTAYRDFFESIAAQMSKTVGSAIREKEEVQKAAALADLDRLERNRLYEIFRQAPAFIAILRGPDHIFEMANTSYYKMVGHRDVVGKPISEALPELKGQGFYELLDRVYRSGEAFKASGLRTMIRPDQGVDFTELYVDLLYQPLVDSEGKTEGILVHGVDQTARQVLEAERERMLENRPLAREQLQAQRDMLAQANEDLTRASQALQLQQDRQAVVLRYLRSANIASANLMQARSRNEIVETVVEVLQTGFNVAVLAFYLASPDGRKLNLVGEVGLSRAPTRSLESTVEIALHAHKVGWVARFRRPFVSNELSRDLHFDAPWLVENHLASAAVLPLSAKDRLLGVVAAFFVQELPLEASAVLDTLASVMSASLDSLAGAAAR